MCQLAIKQGLKWHIVEVCKIWNRISLFHQRAAGLDDENFSTASEYSVWVGSELGVGSCPCLHCAHFLSFCLFHIFIFLSASEYSVLVGSPWCGRLSMFAHCKPFIFLSFSSFYLFFFLSFYLRVNIQLALARLVVGARPCLHSANLLSFLICLTKLYLSQFANALDLIICFWTCFSNLQLFQINACPIYQIEGMHITQV